MSICARDGCEEPARLKVPGGRGRAPIYCAAHGPVPPSSVRAQPVEPVEPVEPLRYHQEPETVEAPPATIREMITQRANDLFAPTDAKPAAGAPPAEPRPQIPPGTGPISRLKEHIDIPPKPTRRGRRQPTDSVWQTIWVAGGMALDHTPYYPVGRMLACQSSVAGPIMDEAIRDTIIDRLVQPLVAMGERGKAAGSLIGPPLLIGLMGTRPELTPMLMPLLRPLLAMMLAEMAPAIAAAHKRDEKIAKLIYEEFPDWGPDPIEGLLEMIFAPRPGEQAPSPVEDAVA